MRIGFETPESTFCKVDWMMSGGFLRETLTKIF